jgi:hypothetical protein
MKATPSLDTYNELLRPAWERFETSHGFQAIQANSDPRLLEAFLLYFSAIGSQMTEPVEGWIRRAASRCEELGFSDLAQALNRHAMAEAGHHLMMIADLRSLAAHWNSRRTPKVDPDLLLCIEPKAGARSYCWVHEENIAGNTPYAQIAIEYEIEQLPLRYGGLFIARCLEIFGSEILSSLSFVTEHIDLDVGHTKFNAQQLAKFIDSHPESLPALVEAGSSALDAYAQFLTDCVALAFEHSKAASIELETPSSFLSWKLHAPLQRVNIQAGEPLPNWVAEVRTLRAAILFDNGRRPHFKTSDGSYIDADPIDLHAWHILAYSGNRLAGCVRVYPLSSGGPPCLTELLLGEKEFSQALYTLGRNHDNAIEVGRWVVDPALRAQGNLAPGIGIQLAAASGALAFALVKQAENADGVAIFSAGSRNRQYLTLSRLGLKPVPGVEAVDSNEYDDVIRVMYCSRTDDLQPRFLRLMDVMKEAIGFEQLAPELAMSS